MNDSTAGASAQLTPSCGNCRFYAMHLAEAINGGQTSECHRFPPAANFGSRLAAFPIVTEGDYCGEFKPAA